MAEGQTLLQFRLLPMKAPDIQMTRKDNGAIYLTPRQAPGDRPQTVPHCLDQRAGEHPDRPFLRERHPVSGEWQTLTYGEAKTITDSLAQAFLDLGAGPDARCDGHTRSPEDWRAGRADFGALLPDVI